MTNLIAAALLAHLTNHPALDRIAEVETRIDYRAIGDHGHSFGAWQMQRAAWERANRKLVELHLQPVPLQCFSNPSLSKRQAAAFTMVLSESFEREHRRPPNWYELYLLWNRGPQGCRSLHRIPPALQQKAQYVALGR